MAQNPQRRQAPPLHIRARNTIGNWVGGFILVLIALLLVVGIYKAGQHSRSVAPSTPPVVEKEKEKAPAKEPAPIPKPAPAPEPTPKPAPEAKPEEEAPATPPTPPVGQIPGWSATREIPTQDQNCVGKTAGYVFACRESRSGWCICQ